MSFELCLLEFALAELFAQVSQSGNVTLADRYGLMAAVLSDDLTDEERFYVDRLLYAAAKGRLTITEDLSMLHDENDSA